MKYLDEYRDGPLAQRLIDNIRRLATRQWAIMEVCGGQTHSLLRHGIESALEGTVDLIHGPGCPVCVTPIEAIDFAQELALRGGVQLASFGDMLRVPGSRRSLLDVRASGGRVKAVYSPLDAVELARRDPATHTVFFAVGFETTAPATALAALQAAELKLTNFSLLVAHVRVQPAMEALMDAEDCRVQAFLAAGHVCTVAGYESYEAFARKYRVPVVVTGFEPLDLLTGIRECVDQLKHGQFTVNNCYPRSASAQGNTVACDIMRQVYEPCDQPWRGFGVLRHGGLKLRPEWSRFDAAQRFAPPTLTIVDPTECRSGEVLSGRIKPPQCPHFATRCTPENPLGAPMVSSEGACAAYYRYREVVSASA